MSQPASQEAEPRAAETTRCAGRSILLVEDDPEIRESLKEALELEGYDVVPAANGREALDRLAHERKPCLILLDLMMPVMNGWEFAEALQGNAELAAIPIIVVTAFGQELQRSKITSQDVLAKPVDLDRLFRSVKCICG